MLESSPFTFFGVRHHGPGSAWGLRQAFAVQKPDLILIEGPADANEMLHWIGHPGMQPPVALLIYRPDSPQKAGTFPFAHFSPEYQALQFGISNDIPTRFFDLPQAHILASAHPPQMPDAAVFKLLAQASGYRGYEQWWNVAIEQRRNSEEMFTAILELMQTIRQAAETERPPEKNHPSVKLAEQREAHMRQMMRQAIQDGFQRVAIVCGAWHAPALIDLDHQAAADREILTDMPSVAVEMAWIPWTYGRLGTFSGYGAGIHSPGWYEHLWQMNMQQRSTTDLSIHWLTQVSNLLRAEALDSSAAHIIEAVRLAEALAALRNQPFPGLPELNEAVQTVMCEGDAAPMQLIQRQLIVGERMGLVPPDTPMVPLQHDLYQQQKALRLRPNPHSKTLDLDLRTELDLNRSHLLHRLALLNIPWGKVTPRRGQMGTYQEIWQLQWQPDFSIRVVEANLWGNTVLDATTAFVQDRADKAETLPVLTSLLNQIILANLPDAVAGLMQRIEDEAALSSDVPHMMDAVLPLARILRYGNVRNTDQGIVKHVVEGLMTRICIGLPSTCAALDDEAAAEIMEKITAVHTTAKTVQLPHILEQWQQTLGQLSEMDRLHGLLSGKVTRLLLDDRLLTVAETAVRMERALSFHKQQKIGIEQLTQKAAWIDGFFKGSGLLLIHDQTLWDLLDLWLSNMEQDYFQAILPLLRRTFSSFSEATRNQINERIRPRLTAVDGMGETAVRFDEKQADAVLPLVTKLLGISSQNK